MARDGMHLYIHGLLAKICNHRAAITYQANASGKLPDDFIVYFKVSGQKRGYFSGMPTRSDSRYQVSYYTRDRAGLETARDAIEKAMVSGGFLFVGSGPELEHPDTGHWSTSSDFRWIKEE